MRLIPGVADGLVQLAPLLRPFITRWWTGKAASLNQHAVRDADALIDFEQFLFGRERVALRRLVNDLTDLQLGDCFYCRGRLQTIEIDHFLPWSHSADDGLDNLVAACRSCNNAKRAILPAAPHVEAWTRRNRTYAADLRSIAETKQWPRDPQRTASISRSLYLHGAAERPTWEVVERGRVRLVTLGPQRGALRALLG